MVDPCLEKLRDGDEDGAWSAFVDRYRRLVFGTIRHYTSEADEVMDVFAHICERLRADGMARFKRYPIDPSPRAAFSTWLVVVVRNLIVDWFRERDGRSRPLPPDDLSPVARQVYECVIVEGHSHREGYELVRERSDGALSHHDYLRALREVYRVRCERPRDAIEVDVDVSSLVDVAARADERVMEHDTRSRLREAMSGLAPDVQLAVQLFVVDEMAAADVARAVGWANAKAVYNGVYRALATIRERLVSLGIVRADA